MKPLQGHRAVVTGASSGIGQEYAKQLAAMGCNLVIAARRLDRLQQLASELQQKHQVKVEAVEIDLLSPDAPRTLFEKATDGGAIVTILVSNAGIGSYGHFTDFPLQTHLATLQINSVAPTELTYRFLSHMLGHKKRSYITHVASIAAFQPTSNFTVYSGTKGYLRYFLETLAFEQRKSNVSISCICPGGTYTEFFVHSGQKLTQSGHTFMMTSQEVVKKAIRAMLNKKTVFVPGLLNKIACFLPRFLPSSLRIHLALISMNRAVQREGTNCEKPVN